MAHQQTVFTRRDLGPDYPHGGLKHFTRHTSHVQRLPGGRVRYKPNYVRPLSQAASWHLFQRFAEGSRPGAWKGFEHLTGPFDQTTQFRKEMFAKGVAKRRVPGSVWWKANQGGRKDSSFNAYTGVMRNIARPSRRYAEHPWSHTVNKATGHIAPTLTRSQRQQAAKKRRRDHGKFA